MKPFLLVEEISDQHRQQVGGKAFSLARLHHHGFRIPKTFCIPIHVYDAYVSAAGLRDSILLEINRKAFDQMRWEEIWDVSLRIRNLFLTPPPAGKPLPGTDRRHQRPLQGLSCCRSFIRSRRG